MSTTSSYSHTYCVVCTTQYVWVYDELICPEIIYRYVNIFLAYFFEY